ncbi:MAG: tRNA(Ile)(2)-agmatinylcytidine synthase [Nitrososphaerota archaeon]|nr:tRNA(Ile)(2)-agmatinylcytidine synthase [Nitrososphaerota archaeon]
MLPIIHIGIDDTDSSRRSCTTYLASLIVQSLLEGGAVFLDYPNLIRLNPNVPWKTRGNGAVALRVMVNDPHSTFHKILDIVEKNSDITDSNPGVVMLEGINIPHRIKAFGELALHKIVKKSQALQIIDEYDGQYEEFGNGRGIIGALAAIGNTLEGDHTFEFLAYRSIDERGKSRGIDPDSVILMSRETFPQTFNNYDFEIKRVLITPRGPDPVLFGIRGENPRILLKAASMIKVSQFIERFMIFRTNQGTNLHLAYELDLSHLKPYTSGHVVGYVSQRPIIGKGGHVYFKIRNEKGEAWCAVYEPSGRLKKVASALIPNDLIEVGGGVRRKYMKYPSIINVEYIKVIKLAKDLVYRNPICNKCGKRMSSEGKGKGYSCLYCGFKDKNAQKVAIEVPRSLKLGLYLPPPHSQRHLTKPFQRYGLEKNGSMYPLIEGWFGLMNEFIKYVGRGSSS